MRIATWNILSGKTVDGAAHPTLTEAIADFDVDVLALQEVDYEQHRSGNAHQPADVARTLHMTDWRFAPSYNGTSPRTWLPTPGVLHGPDDAPLPGPHYGIALFSRIPVRTWHRIELGKAPFGMPLLHARDGRRRMRWVVDEPHQAIAAELENGWTVIATHLTFMQGWNLRQLTKLRSWAHHSFTRSAIIGDFNLIGRLPSIGSRWHTAHRTETYPSWAPKVQFDHILLPDRVASRPVALRAPGLSDHLPLAVDVD